MAPWVNSAAVVGVPTPNPTCVFPRPALMDWVTRSWKETWLALKAMVSRLARLLPVTSIAVEKAESADSAVENEPIKFPLRLRASGRGRLRTCGRAGQHAVDAVQVRAHLNLLFKRAELRELGNELSSILWRGRVLIL